MKVKCPSCGYEVFKRISIEPVTIEVDEETGDLTDADLTAKQECDVKLIATPDTADDVYEYAYKCVKCGRQLQESEMK